MVEPSTDANFPTMTLVHDSNSILWSSVEDAANAAKNMDKVTTVIKPDRNKSLTDLNLFKTHLLFPPNLWLFNKKVYNTEINYGQISCFLCQGKVKMSGS